MVPGEAALQFPDDAVVPIRAGAIRRLQPLLDVVSAVTYPLCAYCNASPSSPADDAYQERLGFVARVRSGFSFHSYAMGPPPIMRSNGHFASIQ